MAVSPVAHRHDVVTILASVLVAILAQGARAVASEIYATREQARACLTQSGVSVSNAPAKLTLGSLGDLRLDFPSGHRSYLSFDTSSAEAQATTTGLSKEKRAKSFSTPTYRLGNVTVDWNSQPTAVEHAVVTSCVKFAAGLPVKPPTIESDSSPPVELGSATVSAPLVFPAKAGAPFRLKVNAVTIKGTTKNVVPTSVRCSAGIGPLVLHGSGAGSCTWQIPASARGKRVSVTMDVTYQGAHKTFHQDIPIV